MTRSIPSHVCGTVNFRDVAPQYTPSSIILPGRLFRSDSVHAVSDSGVDRLHQLGVRTVIDLRSPAETERRPSIFPRGDIGHVHVPLELMSGGEAERTDLTLEALYERMLVERAHGVTSAVRAIAQAPIGGVLVHCTAGKDRTGLTIALALSAVGVSMEQILTDYSLTEHNLRGEWTGMMVEDLVSEGARVDARLLRILAASPPESLSAALQSEVFDRWGSATSYLVAHGLTPWELTSLHDRLLSPISTRSRGLSR